jgi:hypothetical protein
MMKYFSGGVKDWEYIMHEISFVNVHMLMASAQSSEYRHMAESTRKMDKIGKDKEDEGPEEIVTGEDYRTLF